MRNTKLLLKFYLNKTTCSVQNGEMENHQIISLSYPEDDPPGVYKKLLWAFQPQELI